MVFKQKHLLDSFTSLQLMSMGFRPYQLLVSSIAVCSGGVMRNVLERMRMPATDIRIDVKEIVRNPDEANKVEKIHLHFILEGTEINEEKMPRVMELTMKNCSMAQSVSGSIDIVKSYEIN